MSEDELRELLDAAVNADFWKLTRLQRRVPRLQASGRILQVTWRGKARRHQRPSEMRHPRLDATGRPSGATALAAPGSKDQLALPGHHELA
jgi:hypothetical protein